MKKTLKKQLDIEFESSFNERFFNIFSSEDLNSIDNLKIPPILKFNLASKFDTKFISTTPNIWNFYYSGNRLHLNFNCFDCYEKKILKYFLVSFVQVNTPSALDSKLDAFKYAINYFKNNKLKFNFNGFKTLLNHLIKTDKNHFYYDLKFLIKLLFLEYFSGFNMALLHKDLKCKAPLIEPNLRRNLGKWST